MLTEKFKLKTHKFYSNKRGKGGDEENLSKIWFQANFARSHVLTLFDFFGKCLVHAFALYEYKISNFDHMLNQFNGTNISISHFGT